MEDPSEVGMSGPLSSWATGFASSLVRQGYTRNSAISQMQLMAHLSRWLASEGLEARKLRAAEVERFLRARRAAGYTHHFDRQGDAADARLPARSGRVAHAAAGDVTGPVEDGDSSDTGAISR